MSYCLLHVTYAHITMPSAKCDIIVIDNFTLQSICRIYFTACNSENVDTV